MIRLLLSLLLAVTPAYADFGGGGQYQGFWVRGPIPALYRAGCLADTTDTDTYTISNFAPAINASEPALIVVGVMIEDAATVFSVNSVTIDGVAATEINESDGGARADLAGIWRSATLVTAANDIDIVVTMSEATIDAAVCVWAITGLDSITPVDPDGAAGQNGSANSIALTQSATRADGIGIAVCISGATGVNVTWSWDEQSDATSGGIDYSHADNTFAADNAELTADCDWSGTGVVAGAAANWR